MITYIGTIKLWIIVCYLVIYMFLAINLIMMILERKLSKFNTAKVIEEIFNMLGKERNPQEYLLARFYFFGTLVMLLGAVVLLPYL